MKKTRQGLPCRVRLSNNTFVILSKAKNLKVFDIYRFFVTLFLRMTYVFLLYLLPNNFRR